MSNMQSLNNCINRAVRENFGARTAECLKDIRHYVGLHDVAKIVEGRRMKLVDSLIHVADMSICFYLSVIAKQFISICIFHVYCILRYFVCVYLSVCVL